MINLKGSLELHILVVEIAQFQCSRGFSGHLIDLYIEKCNLSNGKLSFHQQLHN
jgi:hypothetical protein